jgi:transcription termination factor Rho
MARTAHTRGRGDGEGGESGEHAPEGAALSTAEDQVSGNGQGAEHDEPAGAATAVATAGEDAAAEPANGNGEKAQHARGEDEPKGDDRSDAARAEARGDGRPGQPRDRREALDIRALKEMSISKLTEVAKDLGVEGATSLLKQELNFKILQAQTE